MIARIARLTAISCIAIAALFAIWKRDAWAAAAVIGGGGLVGFSFWAITQIVDDLVVRQGRSRSGLEGAKADETGAKRAGFPLVKFFTRPAIVAVAAYGMIVRLHLDPIGVLAGVSSLAVAVAVEAVRDLRWRRFL